MAELGFIEFGVEIVMIEDEAHSEEFEETPDDENEIRWITGLQNAESSFAIDFQGEAELRGEGPPVLD